MKLSLKNGLLLGLLIGLASAVLYTPKSGKELREGLNYIYPQGMPSQKGKREI